MKTFCLVDLSPLVSHVSSPTNPQEGAIVAPMNTHTHTAHRRLSRLQLPTKVDLQCVLVFSLSYELAYFILSPE